MLKREAPQPTSQAIASLNRRAEVDDAGITWADAAVPRDATRLDAGSPRAPSTAIKPSATPSDRISMACLLATWHRGLTHAVKDYDDL